jgi:hypothetical protein
MKPLPYTLPEVRDYSQPCKLHFFLLSVRVQFLTILILCLVPDLMAHYIPSSGIVLDAKTREPLPFTNIVVLGQKKGSISNSEGYYVLNLDSISPADTILFSYMGYEPLMIRAEKLLRRSRIMMHPTAIDLKEVEVLYRALSAREIVAQVQRNYRINHPELSARQRIFFHKYEKVPFGDENRITLLKSDFTGLDPQTFDELFNMMPDEFIDYQDAELELYSDGKNHRLVPLKGISLEEESMQAIGNEMEDKLGTLLEEIKKNQGDEDIYYKVRSGIISHKFKKDSVNKLIWEEYKKDSLNYTVETSLVKDDVLFILDDYARLGSKNWEFIRDRGKYDYIKEDLTACNDELVYKISFTPRNRGLFEGMMYVSTSDYAILQLDFEFAEGKQDEKFRIAGIRHSMDFKKATVIFEKGESGYYLKYVNARQKEYASAERQLTIMKKQKRPLVDRELNEIKLDLQMVFDIESNWELLVLDQEEIDAGMIESVRQPLIMKFRKEYAYSPEMWESRTVIAPSEELKKYTRK